MAGFLIVLGDVDDAINTAMTGSAHPDPTAPTGAHDYRERLVFIQRVIAIGPEGRKNINIRQYREQMFNEMQMAKVAASRQGGASE